MHGTVIYLSPDLVVHRGSVDDPTRELLRAALADAVPGECNIAGMILDDPITPLMAVHTREHNPTAQPHALEAVAG